jgi:hypothetical protein
MCDECKLVVVAARPDQFLDTHAALIVEVSRLLPIITMTAFFLIFTHQSMHVGLCMCLLSDNHKQLQASLHSNIHTQTHIHTLTHTHTPLTQLV